MRNLWLLIILITAICGCADKLANIPTIEELQYRKIMEIITSPSCIISEVDIEKEVLTYTCDNFGSKTRYLWYPQPTRSNDK